MRTSLFTLFMLVTQICFAQWYQQNSGTTKNLYAVQFIETNNGFAVGDSGTILNTVNNGTSWNLQVSGTSNALFDVFFIDEQNGWIVGGTDFWPYGLPDSSIILHTTNGGSTWARQSVSTLNTLLSVYFINTNIGWAVGEAGTILKTNDGGANWLQCTSDTLGALSKVVFIDQNNGWITEGTSNGGSPWPTKIYRTTDGGTTWLGPFEIGGTCQEIRFTDSYNGFAIGFGRFMDQEWGIMAKSTDGGENWNSQNVYAPGSCQNLIFIDVFFCY